MTIKQLIDEDFTNYKKASMVVGFPCCDFKCDKEYGKQVCQNSVLATSANISCKASDIVSRYIDNRITSALVCAGLEPFDTFENVLELISEFRSFTNDDVVIYTGYNKEEIIDFVDYLKVKFDNIIIKFGRFIQGNNKHYDDILGIYLASDNQYAERIS